MQTEHCVQKRIKQQKKIETISETDEVFDESRKVAPHIFSYLASKQTSKRQAVPDEPAVRRIVINKGHNHLCHVFPSSSIMITY